MGAAPPVINPAADLPPLPPELSDQPAMPPASGANTTPESKATTPTDSADSKPAPPPQSPPVVGTKPKKKFGTGKIIATILGVLLLVGGVGVGVDVVSNPVLYQSFAAKPISRWREIGNPKARQKARDAYEKQQKALEQKTSTGSYDPTTTLPYRPGGYTRDEVLNSNAALNQAGWDCGGPCPQEHDSDVAGYYVSETNGQYYPIDITIDVPDQENDNTPSGPTPTPATTPSCAGVKAYDASWSLLSTANLQALKSGDSVNFCVSGTNGTFDRAQFWVTGVAQPETTTKGQGAATNDFCQAVGITDLTTTLDIKAKIHDSATNAWVGESF